MSKNFYIIFSRKKNFVFNLLRMRKEGCIKIKSRKNKPRLRKDRPGLKS